MLQLVLIGLAGMGCGMACGRRSIPVLVGVLAGAVVAFIGGQMLGLLGTMVAMCLVVGLFAVLPVPSETQETPLDDAWQQQLEPATVTCHSCQRVLSSFTKICPRCGCRINTQD